MFYGLNHGDSSPLKCHLVSEYVWFFSNHLIDISSQPFGRADFFCVLTLLEPRTRGFWIESPNQSVTTEIQRLMLSPIHTSCEGLGVWSVCFGGSKYLLSVWMSRVGIGGLQIVGMCTSKICRRYFMLTNMLICFNLVAKKYTNWFW